MKKIIIAAAFSSCITAPLFADIYSASFKPTEKIKVYGKDTQIGFEIKNKSRNVLTLRYTLGGLTSSLIGIGPGETYYSSSPLDVTKPIVVHLFLSPSSVFDKKPDKTYEIKPSTLKTIYLTWDDKDLRPQTGPRLGLLGKTDTGLSLKEPGNVQPDDIKQIK